MRIFMIAALSACLVACGIKDEPAVATAGSSAAATRAILATNIDLASCAAGASASCPGFIIEAAEGWMRESCEGAGGKLSPMPQAQFWQLDVDADGKPEYMADLTENFQCEGAWSVFSCGSLGCPVQLFTERDGKWSGIGVTAADDAPEIEVIAGDGYATLRGGCSGVEPCDEHTFYNWNGQVYEASGMEVRGHAVTLNNQGLWTLTREVSVLATPAAGSAAIGKYPAGTEVIVIGAAADPAYKFISPCNACGNGFVPADVLSRQ